MSFWALSDGGNANETGNTFDAGGGDFSPIPKGTSVLALIDEVAWNVYNDTETCQVKYSVLKPEAYQGRIVRQKLWLTDDDPNAKDKAAKRDKAKKMLMALDGNAGGKLGKITGKPTNEQLSVALINKQVVLKLGVWEMGEGQDKKSGNWVQAISPKTAEITEAAKPAKKKPVTIAEDLDDDDVPF